MTIYQKPTCSTCRDVMMRLRDMGYEFESINYVVDPPSREKLGELVRKMGVSPREIIRTKEPLYRELDLGGRDLDDDELLGILAEHPSLIQRPIIEEGDRAILARPAERVEEIRSWSVARGV